MKKEKEEKEIKLQKAKEEKEKGAIVSWRYFTIFGVFCYAVFMESFEKNRLRHSRILIHSLIISGTLNIALIATFAVFALKEKKKTTLPTFTEKRPLRVTLSNKEVLESFYAMPYEELACNLFDETHIV